LRAIFDEDRARFAELQRARPDDVVIVPGVPPIAPSSSNVETIGPGRTIMPSRRSLRLANALPASGTIRSGLRHGFSTGLMSIARPSACCERTCVPAITR
jgi:hypothetical protein